MKSRYRMVGEAVSNSLSLALRIGVIGGSLLFAGYLGWMSGQPAIGQEAGSTIVLLFSGGAILFGILFLLAALVVAITLAASLVISPQGLEYYEWPFYAVVRPWREVTRLEQGVEEGRRYARLVLETPDPIRAQPKETFIYLSKFPGWPGGPLGEEVRSYAPHLFRNTAVTVEQIVGEGDEASPASER